MLGVLAGFVGTSLLPGPEMRVPVRAAAAADVPLTVISYYPAFPPEMVFPRTAETGDPAAVFRQLGQSRIAYFTGDVDRTFWDVLAADHGRLLANAVEWATNEDRPVAVGHVEPLHGEHQPGSSVASSSGGGPGAGGKGWTPRRKAA